MKGWDASHIERLRNKGLQVSGFEKDPALQSFERYLIGIDPGVETGYALWDGKNLVDVKSMMIHLAMEKVLYNFYSGRILVRLEDARKRKWFGQSGREQLQGAGSIKRDCKIWEDFLTYNRIPFELVAPKNNKTKMTADLFEKITGWTLSTNEHARDAAMLVYGFNCKKPEFKQ